MRTADVYRGDMRAQGVQANYLNPIQAFKDRVVMRTDKIESLFLIQQRPLGRVLSCQSLFPRAAIKTNVVR